MNFKNTLLPIQSTLQSKGRLLDISQPVVMGILNATPDSFFNKGQDSDEAGLLRNAEKMLNEGAAILDVGGASTKSGAVLIETDEEMQRVIPIIAAIHKRFPQAWLSVDTYNAATAKEAVAAGADIINDVSSGRFDKNMMQTVAELAVPYIAMHMQGTPETMQQNPRYEDAVTEVFDYLRQVTDQCLEAGIKDIIVDPGFGFGKTVEHNFQLLNALNSFRMMGKPVLAGLSRKSMICKPLKVNPEHALNGTTALNMVALQQGASILRVHDVKEAAEVVKLFQQF
ncbi:MAG: dihydropteroate synthase [Bacteroidetes bacterium]|nr:dihydropteroate synthase [Bacteroidota bacterium]